MATAFLPLHVLEYFEQMIQFYCLFGIYILYIYTLYVGVIKFSRMFGQKMLINSL